MALTLSPVRGAHTVWGDRRVRVYDVEFDDSYPAGGYALSTDDVGLSRIFQAFCDPVFSDGVEAVPVAYSYATGKLLAFQQTEGDVPLPEVTDEDDLSGFAGRVTFIGK